MTIQQQSTDTLAGQPTRRLGQRHRLNARMPQASTLRRQLLPAAVGALIAAGALTGCSSSGGGTVTGHATPSATKLGTPTPSESGSSSAIGGHHATTKGVGDDTSKTAGKGGITVSGTKSSDSGSTGNSGNSGSSSGSTGGSRSTGTSGTTTPAGPAGASLSFTVTRQPACAEGTAVFRAPAVPVTISWQATGVKGVELSVDGPGFYDRFGPSGSLQFTFSCGGDVGTTETHTYTLTTTGGPTISKTISASAVVRDKGGAVGMAAPDAGSGASTDSGSGSAGMSGSGSSGSGSGTGEEAGTGSAGSGGTGSGGMPTT